MGTAGQGPQGSGSPKLGAEGQVPSEGRITGGHGREGEEPPKSEALLVETARWWENPDHADGLTFPFMTGSHTEQPQGPSWPAGPPHWLYHPWTPVPQLILALIDLGGIL